MNNKPVAWRCNKFYETQEGWFYNENGIGEPLYIHPVKELADEEIIRVWNETSSVLPEDEDVIYFARAILRKVEEK